MLHEKPQASILLEVDLPESYFYYYYYYYCGVPNSGYNALEILDKEAWFNGLQVREVCASMINYNNNNNNNDNNNNNFIETRLQGTMQIIKYRWLG